MINVLVVGNSPFDRCVQAMCLGLRGHSRVFLSCRHQSHRRVAARFGPHGVPVSYHSDPLTDMEGFVRDILRVIDERRIDAVLAQGTLHTLALGSAKSDIGGRACVIVEDAERIRTFMDKYETYLICRRIGVPVPTTHLVDAVAAEAQAESIQFPVILKARMAESDVGDAVAHGRVEFLRRVREMTAGIESGDGLIRRELVAQEFVRGHVEDVVMLCRDGDVLCCLSHRRAVCMADTGGGGIFNITTESPQLTDAARRLIRELAWNGAVQLEFMVREDGSFCLIDPNPKFWGTTLLSLAAGMNFPARTVDAFVNRRDDFETAYEVGLGLRWVGLCAEHLVRPPFSWGRFRERWRRLRDSHGAQRTETDLKYLSARERVFLLALALRAILAGSVRRVRSAATRRLRCR